MHDDALRRKATRIRRVSEPDACMLRDDDENCALRFLRKQMVELARHHVERRNRIGGEPAGNHVLLSLGAYLITQGYSFTASPDEEALNYSYDDYRRYLECDYTRPTADVTPFPMMPRSSLVRSVAA